MSDLASSVLSRGLFHPVCRRALLLCASGALAGCVGGPDPEESVSTAEQAVTVTFNPIEGAASFGWTGAVDTDLPLGLVLPYSHTIAAEFMLQYRHAQAAPLMVDRNHPELFSLTYDYMASPARQAKLILNVGGRRVTYNSTPLIADDVVPSDPGVARWRHVAIVRQGMSFLLYLDGVRQIGTGNADPSGNLLILSSTPLPGVSDMLRLGRGGDSDTQSQYFGLIDEVAVFNSALSQSEIASTLVHRKPNRNDTRLSAYYSFDYNAQAPASWVLHSATFQGSVFRRTISATHAQFTDEGAWLTPQNQTTMSLPLKPNDAYLVLWGNGINSHVGGAAFSWDFVRIGPDWSSGQIQGNTMNQPLFSPAAGTILLACDGGDPVCGAAKLATTGPLTDGYNFLRMQHAPGEISTFMHVMTNSINAAFAENGYLFSPTAPGAPGMSFAARQHVANIGTRSAPGDSLNYHLHFAFGDEVMTVPLAFSNYQASDDEGEHWHTVTRGVPAHGQWVRALP